MTNFKTIIATALMAFCGINASAQTDKDYASHPYGFIQLQAGGSTTFTSGKNVMDLVTPTFSIGAGAMWTPVVGTRLHFNGGESKGLIKSINQNYKYKYLNSNFDVMLNVTNMFTKNYYHAFDLYLIGGVGLNYAWDNDEFTKLANNYQSLIKEDISNAWGKGTSRKSLLDHSIRAGILADVNISKNFSIGAEVDINNLSDRFNSKYNDNDDWLLTAQLSLTYKFGHKKIEKQIVPVTTQQNYQAEDEEAKLAAARAKQAEAEALARAEAAKKAQETAKKAEVKPAPVVKEEPLKETFFYNIRMSDPDPEATLNKIVAWCNKYPNKTITVDGYADAGTGTAAINKKYALQRAEKVTKSLIEKGISKDRIKVSSYGDTVQPYSENDRNRCVIVVGK